MVRRYVFVYFLKERPSRIREVAPYHVDYWRHSGVDGYLAGPFADRSGGLIFFDAPSLGEAEAIVHQDPFVAHALLSDAWIKEWIARPADASERDPGP